MEKIFQTKSFSANNDETVISILTNPDLEYLNLFLGGLTVLDENTFNGVSIFNDTVDIQASSIVFGNLIFLDKLIGQIQNQLTLTNDSIVVNYNKLLSYNSLHNILIGQLNYQLNIRSLSLANSIFLGHFILSSNNSFSNSDLICIGNSILSNIKFPCSNSILIGKNIFQEYNTSTDNNLLIGNEIFSELKSNSCNNNCIIGNSLFNSVTSFNNFSFINNSIYGPSILSNCLLSQLTSNLENNVFIGSSILPFITNPNTLKNNTYIGSNILNSTSLVISQDNVLIGNDILFDSNTTSLINTVIFGTNVSLNANINSIQNCLFIGSNISVNSPSIQYRYGLGHNLQVNSDFNLILGHVSSSILPALRVGLGVVDAQALLHLKESNYNETVDLFYIEGKSEDVLKVNLTGMYSTGQFMLGYFTNHSIVIGKTENMNKTKIGPNNVLIGDSLLINSLIGSGSFQNNVLVGNQILNNLVNISSNLQESNVLIGTNLLNGTLSQFDRIKNNTVVGSNLFETTSLNMSTFENLTCFGTNVNISTELKECTSPTIFAIDSLSNNVNLDHIENLFFVGQNSINSSPLTSIDNSFLCGNNFSTSTTSLENTVLIGKNIGISDILFPSSINRTAIGFDINLTDNHSIIFGNQSTFNLTGIFVGIGTEQPLVSLHIVDTQPATSLLIENKTGNTIMSVTTTNPGVETNEFKIYGKNVANYAMINYTGEGDQSYEIVNSYSYPNDTNIYSHYVIETTVSPFINQWVFADDLNITLPASRSGLIYFHLVQKPTSADSISGLITVTNPLLNATNQVLLDVMGTNSYAWALTDLDNFQPNQFTFRFLPRYGTTVLGPLTFNPSTFKLKYLIID